LIRLKILGWAVSFEGAYESVTIVAALLLICCADPQAKAQRLLDQAQILERAGNLQEAQQLLDEVVKGYPQTAAAAKAKELLKQDRALRNLLSYAVAANEATALARMRTIGTAQLIHRSTRGKFGSLEALTDSDLLPGMNDGIANGYKFKSNQDVLLN